MNINLDKYSNDNIVIFIKSLCIKGGAERVLCNLVRSLKSNYNFIIISLDDNQSESAYNLADEVVWIKLGGNSKYKLLDYLIGLTKTFKVLFYLKNIRCIIGWMYLSYIPLILFRTFLKDVKIIASEHIVLEHYKSFLLKRIINYSMNLFDDVIFVSSYAKKSFGNLKNSIVLENILQFEKNQHPKNQNQRSYLFVQ